MSESISAADANRHFSQILRGVREEGATYIVTSHGKPVAKIVPVAEASDDDARERAKKQLLARLRKQPVMNLPRFSRDALYDD
jgi:prevent-host-death family protein